MSLYRCESLPFLILIPCLTLPPFIFCENSVNLFLAMTGLSKGSLGLQLASFIAWAGFTFSSHYSAKLWLNQAGHFHDVLVLSFLQIATGLVIGTLCCLLGGKWRELKVNFGLLFLGACHSYGTLLTNSRYGH